MTTRRRIAACAAVLVALSVSTACAGGAGGPRPSSTTSTTRAVSTPASTPTDPHTGTVAPAPPAPLTIGPPVRVGVPSIGIDSPLQSLGLLSDGTLQSPSQWQVAGWYARGVVPGEPGPAVIAGHVDSVSGPAVFFRLRELTVGAAITITERDGRRQHWVVDDVQQYPKNTFPTTAVYGPTAGPVLRLITCTGDFDRAKRSYVDNLVVSAHLV